MSERRPISALERARLAYQPRLPAVLAGDPARRAWREIEAPSSDDEATIRERFPRTFGSPILEIVDGRGDGATARPLRVGVVLSGGQAPGGHNVIAGLLDGISAAHGASELFGFRDGPGGIVRGDAIPLDAATVAPYRNTGGFDCIGSGRDKIESAADLDASAHACRELALDGLVVVGGDDSNTNAAVLAEHFAAHDVPTVVHGVPKTIDGDLKNAWIEASFGFDTATRVYAELVGNIARDAASSRKYWHFVRLMGRSASHVTLECALRVHPNSVWIGEEVRRDGLRLRDVVREIVRVVRARAAAGRRYGVCLVPEGLIEFVPEIRVLIDELNVRLAEGVAREEIASRLSPDARAAWEDLPPGFRGQLLIDRDSHGNVQVSKIETERLLMELVASVVADDADVRFHSQNHFLGYEGRCAAPSNFDADYTATLGRIAAALVHSGRTGYVCAVGNLAAPADAWMPRAVPIPALLGVETRKGVPKPVIRKALVDLEGAPFRTWRDARATAELDDAYRYPGAMQYFGPPAVSDDRTATLNLESRRS